MADLEQIEAMIIEKVQPRCRGCVTAKLGANVLAKEILRYEFEATSAAEQFAESIARECYGGEELASGQVKCWYGIRTPVTPPHLRDDMPSLGDDVYA